VSWKARAIIAIGKFMGIILAALVGVLIASSLWGSGEAQAIAIIAIVGMSLSELVGVIIVLIFLGVHLGFITGWTDALHNPPKEAVEIMPVFTWRDVQWPRHFIYAPSQQKQDQSSVKEPSQQKQDEGSIPPIVQPFVVTETVRKRFEVMEQLKREHLDWDQKRLAAGASAQTGEDISEETVRNTYRAMKKQWQRGVRKR